MSTMDNEFYILILDFFMELKQHRRRFKIKPNEITIRLHLEKYDFDKDYKALFELCHELSEIFDGQAGEYQFIVHPKEIIINAFRVKFSRNKNQFRSTFFDKAIFDSPKELFEQLKLSLL